MHVDLIGPYSKSIRQQQPGGSVILKNSILTCLTMIDQDTGWFEIFEIPTFDLEEVTISNDDYMDKSFTRVSHMFNNTWLCRDLCPQKVVFYNGSEFKLYFTPLLKDFDVNHS